MKKQKLIILRGNSGSGKSTVAAALQQRMGYGTARIEQDYIRRMMLREREKPGLPNIQLIALNAQFALAHGYDVIIEGILREERYGEMLRTLLELHAGPSFVYYFDVALEETLRRHETKPNAHEFGEKEMRSWFQADDYLNVADERIIPEDDSFDVTVTRILKDVSA